MYVRTRDVKIRVPPAYAWRHTLVVLHAPYGAIQLKTTSRKKNRNYEEKSDAGHRIALHQISLFVVGIGTASNDSATLLTDIVRHPGLAEMSETFNAQ